MIGAAQYIIIYANHSKEEEKNFGLGVNEVYVCFTPEPLSIRHFSNHSPTFNPFLTKGEGLKKNLSFEHDGIDNLNMT